MQRLLDQVKELRGLIKQLTRESCIAAAKSVELRPAVNTPSTADPLSTLAALRYVALSTTRRYSQARLA